MSHVRNAKFSDAISSLSLIAKTIAVPHDYKPMRLPTFPNLERTSVMQFMSNSLCQAGLGSSGSARFALCRSPTYPFWGDAQLTEATAYRVTPYDNSYTLSNSTRTTLADNFDKYSVVGGNTRTYPLGWAENKNWVYHARGGLSQVRLTFNATGGNIVFAIGIEIWTPDGVDSKVFTATSVPAGTTAIDMSVLDSNDRGCWWRPVWLSPNGASATGATVTIGWCTGGSIDSPMIGAGMVVFQPFVEAPEFTTTTLPYEDARCTASSLLLSNVGKVLNKEGVVVAARLNYNSVEYDMFNIEQSTFDNIHPQEKYFGPLEKGLYCFSMPDSESSEFHPSLMRPSGVSALKVPIFRLDSLSYFTAIYTSEDPTEVTPLAYTVDWHTEFRSQSILFPRGYSTTTLETYHSAQMALSQITSIHENPVHLSAIAQAVAKAVRVVAPIVAPYAISAAKSVGSKIISNASKRLNISMPQDSLVSRDRQVKSHVKPKKSRVARKRK